MSIDLVEAVWVLVNVTALILTLRAYVDARADREAVRVLNGPARELVATGFVRHAGLLVIAHVLLLSVVVPGLFIDRPVVLSPIVAALMAVPIVLLTSSAFDYRDRRRLARLVVASAHPDNPRITQAAGELADAAFDEASET
jgi:hypothetical protein